MDLKLISSLITEARKKEELSTAFKKFSKKAKLIKERWTRSSVLSEVDPDFIHHEAHYEALIHGGVTAPGKHFPGGGGLRWGGLEITKDTALLRVLGSFEYKGTQEQYQQEIKFGKAFKIIAEAKEFNWLEKARLIIQESGIHVDCQCDSFRFYHRHAATVKGFALIPEDVSAPINNPENRGGLCKHLNLTLKFLGAQASQMAGEMKHWYEKRNDDV